MTFRPHINDAIQIEGTQYTFKEHPAARGMPYGQTGRKATVFQVEAEQQLFALKVFTPAHREPRTSTTAGYLKQFSGIPGLQVCNRTVITPETHGSLLAEHPDLAYAVLMPWVEGETWQELMVIGRMLTPDQSRGIASELIRILDQMEQKGLAHCDISGPNVLVGLQNHQVSLVDVEDMYAAGLPKPDFVSSGSAGYSHRSVKHGSWSLVSDRFAGAILIAEMLGWSDERVRRLAFGEQYFDLAEIQEGSERYQVMLQVLRERWGNGIVAAFSRAWYSNSLEECPSFAEWAQLMGVRVVKPVDLPTELPQDQGTISAEEKLVQITLERAELLMGMDRFEEAARDLAAAYQASPQMVGKTYGRALMSLGSQKEHQGDLAGALEYYRQAHLVMPEGALRDELSVIISEVAMKISSEKSGNVDFSCPECGNPLQPDSTKCPYCGYSIIQEAESVNQIENSAAEPEPNDLSEKQESTQPPPEKKKKNILGWIFIGILLFGVILLGFNNRQKMLRTEYLAMQATSNQQSTLDMFSFEETLRSEQLATEEWNESATQISMQTAHEQATSTQMKLNTAAAAAYNRTQTAVSKQTAQTTCDSMRVCEQVTVLGTMGWQNYGINVTMGEQVDLQWVSGAISNCAPNGCPFHDGKGDGDNFSVDSGDNNIFGCMHGALIAKVGNGIAICVGNSRSFVADATGTLWLRTNDNVATDNDGSWVVRVEIE